MSASCRLADVFSRRSLPQAIQERQLMLSDVASLRCGSTHPRGSFAAAGFHGAPVQRGANEQRHAEHLLCFHVAGFGRLAKMKHHLAVLASGLRLQSQLKILLGGDRRTRFRRSSRGVSHHSSAPEEHQTEVSTSSPGCASDLSCHARAGFYIHQVSPFRLPCSRIFTLRRPDDYLDLPEGSYGPPEGGSSMLAEPQRAGFARTI